MTREGNTIMARKWDEAIAALVVSRTIKDAAAKVDVDEKTLRKWLKNEEFAADYAEKRTEVVDTAIRDMQEFLPEAITLMKSRMRDGKLSGAAFMAGVRILAEFATGHGAEAEIRAQLDSLRRELEGGGNS